MFKDMINKLTTPKQSSGKWVNGKFVPNPAPEQPLPEELTFRVEGAHHHADQIETLAIPMRKWTLPDKVLAEKFTLQKIYQYYFKDTTASFVPEKDRIKVMINDMHVGYVPDREVNTLKKMLFNPVTVSAQIGGGKYKVVSQNGDAVYSDDYYYVKIKISR